MIARLLRLLSAGAVYFCLATVLSQVLLLGYFVSSGRLNRNSAVQLVSILQGVDLLKLREEAEQKQINTGPEQVSLQEVAAARAAKLRDLEVREQALTHGLDQLEVKRQKLSQDLVDYQTVRSAFEKELESRRLEALAEGNENVRTILSGIKPKQAKELIVQMLNRKEYDAVVTLMIAMPTQKKTKIVAEFKTPSETEQLDDILRRMRNGQPMTEAVDSAQAQLSQAANTP